MKNLDSLLKEEDLPAWYFGIEKKTYKDTLDIHKDTIKSDRKTKSYIPTRESIKK